MIQLHEACDEGKLVAQVILRHEERLCLLPTPSQKEFNALHGEVLRLAKGKANPVVVREKLQAALAVIAKELESQPKGHDSTPT